MDRLTRAGRVAPIHREPPAGTGRHTRGATPLVYVKSLTLKGFKSFASATDRKSVV